jgi:ubiquinone/menaquinone biosynthesis C-methylase UbiE
LWWEEIINRFDKFENHIHNSFDTLQARIGRIEAHLAEQTQQLEVLRWNLRHPLRWFFRKLRAKFRGAARKIKTLHYNFFAILRGIKPIIPRDKHDYNAWGAIQALQHCNVKGKKVLVVGCNRGEDCLYFLQSGAVEIHGVDVIDEIGINLRHKKVHYHQCSAENMTCFPDNTFDLVYTMATLEHIPDVETTFREMHRVCKPGGIIFSLAAPLWNSRFGHHKGDLFTEYPWIHLLLNHEEIVDWFMKHKAQAMPDKAVEIEHHVSYMLHRDFFNKRPGKDYLVACDNLGTEIIINKIDFEPEELLTLEAKKRLLDVYGKEELLGLTHRFIGRKNKNR